VHVAPLDVLAEAAVTTALAAEQAVFGERRRADRAIAHALRNRRDLAAPDHRFIARSVFALFRWHGWVEGLRLHSVEERLLLSWLLDSPLIHPVCRVWARAAGRDAGRLVALGDAPSWTARAEGLKRWVGGRAVNADPWRLFPSWLRDHLPLPPGVGSPKLKSLAFLEAMQTRPSLWVRAQAPAPAVEDIWGELRDAGLKPWLHRAVTTAAKLDPDTEVYALPAFARGVLEIQDIASQAVGLVCDPDPGERWWDACAGAGGKALHLAAIMGGKGVVVATDSYEPRLKETVRRARRSPFRNITTKLWDGDGKGKHPAGKPKSFDGVLVDAPCSAIGTWRRNPDARWTLDREAIPRLAELQLRLLRSASVGVRPGGSLVYSVCTVTPAETQGVVRQFLETAPDFQLDPFPHPLSGVETPGTLQIWPQDADCDAMFVARMVRRPS
jgi:16S rRNA (cytosine967-C5)-methyltransferase